MISQRNIGLFFGSYNPIHIGHMAIANYMAEYTEMDQVWFIVSPQNPFKKRKNLLDDHHRLEMVRLAIDQDDRFMDCDIEFKMPKPSYTIDTLAYLEEKHPRHRFLLIMGSDALPGFHEWKNAGQIIENYTRYVYPRKGYKVVEKQHRNIVPVDAPEMGISASLIRRSIREGRDMRHFLPPGVWDYIDRMNLYRDNT